LFHQLLKCKTLTNQQSAFFEEVKYCINNMNIKKHFIVQGEGGSGKTFIAQYMILLIKILLDHFYFVYFVKKKIENDRSEIVRSQRG
jgi:ABC-type oligopeptide transport system ATPase subunit